MKLSSLTNKSRQYLVDHAPVILTGVGILGTAATGILAARAGFKAGYKVASDETVLGIKEETTSEYRLRLAKETWPMYISPVITGSSTIAAIVMANRINSSRLAGLAAAYAIADRAHEQYQDKVAEVVGEKKEKSIHDKTVQDQFASSTANKGLVILGEGKVLCYDPFSDRCFESSMEDLKKAQNDTNYEILNNLYVSLNEFYKRIGLPAVPWAEEIGWGQDTPLELDFTSVITEDQKPALAFTFRVRPNRGYQEYPKQKHNKKPPHG